MMEETMRKARTQALETLMDLCQEGEAEDRRLAAELILSALPLDHEDNDGND